MGDFSALCIVWWWVRCVLLPRILTKKEHRSSALQLRGYARSLLAGTTAPYEVSVAGSSYLYPNYMLMFNGCQYLACVLGFEPKFCTNTMAVCTYNFALFHFFFDRTHRIAIHHHTTYIVFLIQ